MDAERTSVAPGSDFEAGLVDAQPALRRFAAVLVSVHERDDLVQDTLARALVKRAMFSAERGNLTSWLCAIMLNLARGRWRRRQCDLRLGESVVWDGLPEVAVDVRAAVDRLPRRQRAAVILFYFVDLPISDAAGVLQCSPGTVKSALSDARTRLSKELKDYAQH